MNLAFIYKLKKYLSIAQNRELNMEYRNVYIKYLFVLVCELQSRGIGRVLPLSAYSILFDVLPEEGLGGTPDRMFAFGTHHTCGLTATPVHHANSWKSTPINWLVFNCIQCIVLFYLNHVIVDFYKNITNYIV